MKSGFFIAILSVALLGCGGEKNVQKTVIPETPRPEWVNTRPISGSYYIGIGSASKTTAPADFQNIAKKNALNDLVSEIKVTVKGETFLNSMEINRKFTEEFNSSIQTSTNEEIENFDIVGVWENKTEYWVYYRLSKSDHARRKQEKKSKILNSSADFFLKAKDAEMERDLAAAADMYIRALLELKPYWDEVNEFELGDKKVFLDNEIYQSLQKMLLDLKIEPSVNSIELSASNEFSVNVKFLVHMRGNPVKSVPVMYNYDRGKFMAERQILTDNSGTAEIEVNKVNTLNKENELKYRINYAAFGEKATDRKLVAAMLDPFENKKYSLPIKIKFPTVSVASTEKANGTPTGGRVLSDAFISAFSQSSFAPASAGAKGDFLVSIESEATPGGTSSGFHVAYLRMTVSVTKNADGKEIYRNTFPDIKGVQLSPEAAINDAYKKAADKTKEEIVPLIIKTVL